MAEARSPVPTFVGQAVFVGDLAKAPTAIMPFLEEGDILILMGAGSIDEISGFFEQALSIP